MIVLSNPKPLKLWKALHMEVAASGLAEVDASWKMENVRAPFSRLYFIPRGGGTLTLCGREIALLEGWVYLIPAGLLYHYRCDFSMQQLYFHINIIQENGIDLFYGCSGIYGHSASADYLEKVLALYRSSGIEEAFRLQGILWEELGTFTKMAGIQEERTKVYSRLVEEVFDFAQNPVSARNRVRSLAERLHVSESTLSKRFRHETGMTPGGYLEQLVIQKACRLLINGDKTMSQIAEELEFSDQFYFARFFKRQMHMTPSAYRRQMQWRAAPK